MQTGKNYIGSTLSAKGTMIFNSVNPKTNEEKGTFINATKEEVDLSVKMASAAFPVYSAKSSYERAAFLEAIADEIMNIGETLIKTYCEESGLMEGRAIGERGRTINQLKAFADYLRKENWKNEFSDKPNPERLPIPKPKLFRTSVPIGPIAVFGASNFPLAFSTAGGDTASALAAGCTVVVKGHPLHPGTGELVASAIIKASKKTEMPDGIFSNLNSSGIEVGKWLVEHSGIKGVAFTGGLKGGRALYNLAAKRETPIPVFAEMGSINPVIVTPGAIKKRGLAIAQQIAESFTLGGGQFCTSPGLIIMVDSADTKQFEIELIKASKNIAPQCMLHKGIKEAFKNVKNALIQTQGVTVLHAPKDSEDNMVNGTIIKVNAESFLKNGSLQTEVFGPFTMIVRCLDFDKLYDIIENLNGQLTASLLAEKEEFEHLKKVVKILQHKAGRLTFNGMPTGVEVSPAMTHGGPYPASTDSRFTSVGIESIKRWLRPVSFQNFPEALLP